MAYMKARLMMRFLYQLINIFRMPGLAIACLAYASFAQSIYAQVPNLPGWVLAWNDEFETSSLDTSRWEALNRKDSFNNEKQYYLPDQVSVSGGQLHLTATDQPLAGKPYRSGLVRTWGEQTFGRWEVRADLPTTQGMWPAIWLLPRTVTWPLGGEIDIMENRGSEPFKTSSAYHWNTTPGTSNFAFGEYSATQGGQPVNFHEGFHNYAVEWEADQIRYYVDDNLHFTVDSPQAPQTVPMSLIINLAVGGDFGGDPDGTTVFPQNFDIEYVRVWQRDTTPAPVTFANGGFDDAGGSLNSWTTFGNTIPNVNVEPGTALNGTHSLKIFGQFNGSENFSGVSQGITVTEGQTVTADASTFIQSQDTLFGKSNEVFMKLEYYSTFGAAFGSVDFLGEAQLLIADGTTAENTWLAHQLTGTAPIGAVEARIGFVFRQPGFDNGAIFIDGVSFTATDPALTGDLDGDGFVGISDLNLVLGAWNASIAPGAAADPSGDGFVGISDLNIVLGAWNLGTPPTISVPEPAVMSFFLVGWLSLSGRTRRSVLRH
ncbi:MAG: family 16 glycosylhydrolase [Nannocystaceae bacterium]|nr:family 16 glycosylhydrolase [Nannocystaceae bacterium]